MLRSLTMSKLSEKLLTALDQAVTGKSKPDLLDGDPLARLSRRILELAKMRIGSEDERAFLAKQRDAYRAGQQIIKQYNYDSAHAAWVKHRTDLATAAANGTIHDLDGWSEAELYEDHVAKMTAGKAACRQAGNACLSLARELAAQFAAVADRFAAKQLELERKAYEEYGLPYPGPSQLVQELQNAGKTAMVRIPSGESAAGTGPTVDSMITFLDL